MPAPEVRARLERALRRLEGLTRRLERAGDHLSAFTVQEVVREIRGALE